MRGVYFFYVNILFLVVSIKNISFKTPEIELCDVEEDQLYKFPITQENYDKIIAGDLELASKLLNDQKTKSNFVAAFYIMKNSSNVVTEKQQNLSAPSMSSLGLENEKENTEAEEASEEPTESMDENEDQDNTPGKIWTRNSTVFFIGLCKKYDKEFETGVKKYLWTKIANEMSQNFNQKFTAQQVDTKCKCLKKMYKQVKKHNSQSGNNRKNWEYHDLMEEIMFSKPEMCARATCSNISGLSINGSPCNVAGASGEAKNGTITDEGSLYTSSLQFVSAFTSKRKHVENKSDKRHKDKMQRQDRYLDLERLTAAVEKSVRSD